MPNYPNYRGELPLVLQPYNWRHYFLLSYWVFFRPTGLNCYLHRVQSSLPRSEHWWQRLKQVWMAPAYRNFYLMLPIAFGLVFLMLIVLLLLYVFYNLQGHTSGITGLAIIPNTKQVISASANRSLNLELPSTDNTLKIWDWQTGAEIKTLKGHAQGVAAIAVTADGKKAISAGRDRSINIWNLERGQILSSVTSHKAAVLDVAIAPGGQQAVSASTDTTIKVWNLNTGKEQLTLTGHQDFVSAVSVTLDDKIISGSGDRTLKVWDLNQNGALIHTLTGHQGGITSLALVPNSSLVVSASSDRTLKVWNWKTGQLVFTLRGHQDEIAHIVVTPNGKEVISGSYDRTIKVWDLKTGKLLHTLAGHQGSVTSLAITIDGKKVISASSDRTVKVWDLIKAKEIYTLKGHQDWVTSLTVTPDGKKIISGSFDRFPKIWNLDTGKELPTLVASAQLWLIRLGIWLTLLLLIISLILATSSLLATGLAMGGIAGTLFASFVLLLLSGTTFSLVMLFSDRVGALTMMRESTLTPIFQTFGPIILGVSIGLIWHTVMGLIGRRAIGLFSSVILAWTIAGITFILITGSIARPAASWVGPLRKGLDISLMLGGIFTLLIGIGGTRILFYPWHLWGALTKKHPLSWDELLMLPVPWGQNYLQGHLQKDETTGLQLISDVVGNPWQRTVVQKTLHYYLHHSRTPIHFIYRLVSDRDLERSVISPITQQDWECLPTTKQVLLGTIANQWVESPHSWANQLGEILIKFLTWWGRNHQQTPLTKFAWLLQELDQVHIIQSVNFDLAKYERIYNGLMRYPGGEEIGRSFGAMATFLGYHQLSQLPEAANFGFTVTDVPNLDSSNNLLMSNWLFHSNTLIGINAKEAIRPAVITALAKLGDVGKQVAIIFDRPDQLEVLVNALVQLEKLQREVKYAVISPEKEIIEKIIQHWRELILSSIELKFNQSMN